MQGEWAGKRFYKALYTSESRPAVALYFHGCHCTRRHLCNISRRLVVLYRFRPKYKTSTVQVHEEFSNKRLHLNGFGFTTIKHTTYRYNKDYIIQDEAVELIKDLLFNVLNNTTVPQKESLCVIRGQNSIHQSSN